MGHMNATGHVLAAAPSADALWDLLIEFSERTESGPPGLHYSPERGLRYCVHPSGEEQEPAFVSDDLREALFRAAYWRAQAIDPDFVWRRS